MSTPANSRSQCWKLLPEEREANRLSRQKKHNDLDAFFEEADEKIQAMAREAAEKWPTHTADYYYKTILSARKEPGSRKTNDWNVFQSMEIKKANDGMFSCIRVVHLLYWMSFTEREDGAPRLKAGDLSKSIAEKWAGLSHEERQEAIADVAPQFEAQRAETRRGRKQLPNAISSDVEQTLNGLETRVYQNHYLNVGG